MPAYDDRPFVPAVPVRTLRDWDAYLDFADRHLGR